MQSLAQRRLNNLQEAHGEFPPICSVKDLMNEERVEKTRKRNYSKEGGLADNRSYSLCRENGIEMCIYL